MSYQQEIAAAIRAALPAEKASSWPTAAFTHMRARFLDYVVNETLVCAFPALEEYADTAGRVQSGFVAAGIEQTLIPFAMLLAGKPCSTLTLNIAFVRAMKAGEGEFTVTASLRALTRSVVFLEAKVASHEGRTAATASASLLIASEL